MAPRQRRATAHVETATEVFRYQLDAAMHARGWSQRRLAEELAAIGSRVTRDIIKKIMLGSRQPRLDEVLEIAAALGTSPLYLVVPQSRVASLAIADLEPLQPVQAEGWWLGIEPLPHQNEALFYSLRGDLQQFEKDVAPDAFDYVEGFIVAMQGSPRAKREWVPRALNEPQGDQLVDSTGLGLSDLLPASTVTRIVGEIEHAIRERMKQELRKSEEER